MVIMYKLTTQENTTHGGMKWEIGKKNKATFPGSEMCTNQVLHCYSDPHLAVLFNPIHANIRSPKLFKIECSKLLATDGLKHACKSQTPAVEMALPVITITQKVAFAIKCALLVYQNKAFVQWATNWLNGTDRTKGAAAAAAAAYAAAVYAARAARADAADADAAYAAYAARAADAAYAAAYADAAYAAAYAAAVYAAAYAAADAAAYAAAYAARAAAAVDACGIDFKTTIAWVMDNIS